jgi:iron complex outermembrane receptor protein
VHLALLAITSSALAPSIALAADDERPEEIIITGSAIKRTDAETSVPVTVLTVDELKLERGITTVESLLTTLSTNQPTMGTSQAVGLSTGGASFADMRGIGPNKTLVLLNGRRIANNAFDSSAPDLNAIPLAAIDRVEVLRDGASSLYGTDAIGGVINFITKADYQGVTATAGYDSPVHPGGVTKSANVGGGFGDLASDGFNVFGFIDYQKQDNITGTQRDFNQRFAGGLSATPMPANFFQGTGALMGNPAAPDCTNGIFTIPSGNGTSCSMTTSSFVDYIPRSERVSALLKGDFKLSQNHTLGAEYSITRSKVATLIAPVPYAPMAQNPFLPDGKTRNPYYPTNPNITLDPTYDGSQYVGDWADDYGCVFGENCTLADVGITSGRGTDTPLQPGFVWVRWRDIPNGPRGDNNVSLQQRFLLSLQGTAGAWDYDVGASYNRTTLDENLISGYGDGDAIAEGIVSGIINPYGDQSSAGSAYLDKALLKGLVMFGRGENTTFDGRISHAALGNWTGAGEAAVAFGMEYRNEKFLMQANHDYAQLVSASTGIDPETLNTGSRNIVAAYTELNVPLLDTLELTAAGRFDHYSDFGSTINPKLSLRWQPVRQLVLRSSASTGFRAPSLYDLYSAQAYTNTDTATDPVTCPGGPGTGSDGAPDFCNDQFVALSGGNVDLNPEKSKSFTLGFVAEPLTNLNFGADYWFVQISDLIGALPYGTILDANNLSWSSAYIHRNGSGALSDATLLCPGSNCGYVDVRTQNSGDMLTDGVDLNANYRLRTDLGQFTLTYNSTWVRRYDYQDYTGGPWNRNVGAFVGAAPVFRWKHELSANWVQNAFSAGVTLHSKSGYTDDPTGMFPEGVIGNYNTVDIFGGWEPLEGMNLIVGVRNATDKAPPISGQLATFQVGYDPRFYDPTGRLYYARVSYNFNPF